MMRFLDWKLKFRTFLRRQKIVQLFFYCCKIDNLCVRLGIFGFSEKMNAAICGNLSEEERLDVDCVTKLRHDMIDCYLKYKILPSEYFLFEFKNKNAEQRATYVSDTYMNSTLARIVGRRAHDRQLNDKYNFYKLMWPYFKRKVVRVKNYADFASYEKMALEVNSLIAKPNNSSVGCGIGAIVVNLKEEAKASFESMLSTGGEWIVEERICQSKSMAKWNSSSVNTVRVSACLTKKGWYVLSSVLRTGRLGSIVDNAGRGGILAAIDSKTGVIVSDGIDKHCNQYEVHPDSKCRFKGCVIPQWGELLSLAEEVHRRLPNQIYVGWDFALTNDGWVLIEGNWGELGGQQVAFGSGLKPMFDNYISQGRV